MGPLKFPVFTKAKTVHFYIDLYVECTGFKGLSVVLVGILPRGLWKIHTLTQAGSTPPNETIALCRASHALTRKYSSSITHSLQVNPCGALLLCGTTSCFCGGTYLDIRFGCGHRNTLIPTLKFSTMFAGILELYKMCPMDTALYEAHGL